MTLTQNPNPNPNRDNPNNLLDTIILLGYNVRIGWNNGFCGVSLDKLDQKDSGLMHLLPQRDVVMHSFPT